MSEEILVIVGYAYPTSNYASKCGFSKTGCYTVAKQKGHIGAEYDMKGFSTWRAAQDYAESLKLPFGRYTMAADPSPKN